MIEIVTATEDLARALVPLMTEIDQSDLVRLSGGTALDALLHGVRASTYGFCAVENGTPLAMGGVIPHGSLLSPSGWVWLVTQPQATAKPITFLRHAKRQIAIMKTMFATLQNFERVGKENSRHWVEWLGFQFGEEAEVNGIRVMPIEVKSWA